VFGDEIGSWMIPVDEQVYMAAYLTSLAATTNPEEFTAAVLPLLRRDSRQNFVAQAYPSAIGVATQEQRTQLDAEIQRQGIRTERDL